MIEDTYNTLIEDGYFITSGIIEEKYQDIESNEAYWFQNYFSRT